MDMRDRVTYFGQVKLSELGHWCTVTNECDKESEANTQIHRLLTMLKEPPIGIRTVKVTTTYEVC